ncbi:hypothetical protein FVF58_15865 [Paraburkholderia panacisoli]|uniref:Uncharacterized protein n=1 Tax=Paraburkholderia panacisoli TaxID=2603818 RepID=A0A5B0H8J4_9BURK|nr:hypothetical protein [Paraburkholderia panacisoli]KAA1011400.1 hypothetical protein FVF58_15865 [Paraburkholderia panacisoli]
MEILTPPTEAGRLQRTQRESFFGMLAMPVIGVFFYQGSEMMRGPQPGLTPFVADVLQLAYVFFAVLAAAGFVHSVKTYYRARAAISGIQRANHEGME